MPLRDIREEDEAQGIHSGFRALFFRLGIDRSKVGRAGAFGLAAFVLSAAYKNDAPFFAGEIRDLGLDAQPVLKWCRLDPIDSGYEVGITTVGLI